MMPIVPVNVNEAAIVSLVLDNLLLGHLKALTILEISLTHRENLTCLLSPDRGLACSVNRDWRPHLLK